MQEAYEQIPPSRALVPLGVGQPTKFKQEYCEKVEGLCRLGLTDKQIAEYFDVSLRTLYNWKLKHPEYLRAEKRGKQDADERVAEFLWKKATGQVEGGCTTAAIFWLKNRQRNVWSDRKEHAVATVSLSQEDWLKRLK